MCLLLWGLPLHAPFSLSVQQSVTYSNSYSISSLFVGKSFGSAERRRRRKSDKTSHQESRLRPAQRRFFVCVSFLSFFSIPQPLLCSEAAAFTLPSFLLFFLFRLSFRAIIFSKQKQMLLQQHRVRFHFDAAENEYKRGIKQPGIFELMISGFNLGDGVYYGR